MGKGIVWDEHFDAVFVLSLADYIERRNLMREELHRVGIEASGILHWKITVRNAFYSYIWRNPSFPSPRWWLNREPNLNCTMGHYEIMKESLARGFRRILILEDDVRFLRDTAAIAEILDDLPEGWDIAMLDYNIPEAKTSYNEALRSSRVNGHYFRFDTVRLWSTGCYALSAKAMRHITQEQERNYRPADEIYNRMSEDDGLLRVAAIRNIAVQDMRLKGEQMNDIDRHLYDGIAELKDYNLMK